MYTPHIMIDSRDLLRKKFMKKSRIHNIAKSEPTVSYMNEPEPELDVNESFQQDRAKHYRYIFDDPLSREFNYEENTDDKQIFVCLYKQNAELALPYITYSLVDYNNTLHFPNIDVASQSSELKGANTSRLQFSSNETIERDEQDSINVDEELDEEELDDEELDEEELDEEDIEENEGEDNNSENSQDILPIEENDYEDDTIENNEYIVPIEDNNHDNDNDNVNIENSLPNDDDETNYANNIINDDENDDYLFARCSQYINNNVIIEDNISYECYKGFVELDGNIYAFFDVTDVDFNDNFNEKSTSCTIDELMQPKKVPGLVISENISKLFHTENILKYVYDVNNKPIYNPITVYLCENLDDEYVNSTYSDTNHSISLTSEKIEHPIVGNTYLFTSKLLDVSTANICKRYALFHNNAVYVLHEPFIATEYDVIPDNACVCFISDGIEYWSVKNIDLFAEI